MRGNLHHRVHVAEWLNAEMVTCGRDILTSILSTGGLLSVTLLFEALKDFVEICGACRRQSWWDDVLMLNYCLS